jgi:hypothetical protein
VFVAGTSVFPELLSWAEFVPVTTTVYNTSTPSNPQGDSCNPVPLFSLQIVLGFGDCRTLSSGGVAHCIQWLPLLSIIMS